MGRAKCRLPKGKINFDNKEVVMKVSNFLRYLISFLGVVAGVLGAIFFIEYFSSETFKESYGRYDDHILFTTFALVIMAELVNMGHMIIKACHNTQTASIKTSAKIWLIILVGTAVFFLIKGEIYYQLIGGSLISAAFFVAGDMVEYNEVVDVETTYEYSE